MWPTSALPLDLTTLHPMHLSMPRSEFTHIAWHIEMVSHQQETYVPPSADGEEEEADRATEDSPSSSDDDDDDDEDDEDDR